MCILLSFGQNFICFSTPLSQVWLYIAHSSVSVVTTYVQIEWALFPECPHSNQIDPIQKREAEQYKEVI